MFFFHLDVYTGMFVSYRVLYGLHDKAHITPGEEGEEEEEEEEEGEEQDALELCLFE
jgi:hypothetical protein